MKCPKCKTAELKKSNDASPCFCDTCGGMWILNVEGTDLQSMTIDQTEAEAGSAGNDVKTGMCPAGHGIMIRAKVDIDEPFYLERCSVCGGIWFDKGEWLRIVENNLVENLGNIWSRSWQRKHSREKDRKHFLELNRKLLGDRVFSAVMILAEDLKDHPEKNRAVALLQREIM